MRTTQPVATATGQPYGAAKAQADQQAAIPLENAAGAQAQAAAPAPGMIAGALGQSIFDDTARPDEPVTQGAASGPGAGPEALVTPPSTEAQDIAGLAPYIPALEALSAMPGTSVATRNFVRRLRGAS